MQELKETISNIDSQLLYTVIYTIIKLVALVFIWYLSLIILRRIFRNIKEHHITNNKQRTLYSVARNLSNSIISFIIIFQILTTLGFSSSLLAIFTGMGSIAVGLGSKDLMSDIVSGIFILFDDVFDVGDTITISNITGVVEHINLRSTKIRGLDGNFYVIPNSQMKIISNHNKEYNLAIIDIKLSYASNLKENIETIEQTLDQFNRDERHILNGAMKVKGIEEFQDNYLTLRIQGACTPEEYVWIERNLSVELKEALDQNNVVWPSSFPTVQISKEAPSA